MAHTNGGNGTKVLVRSRKDCMLAGICSGAAEHIGLDMTLARVVVAVFCVMTGGAGVLAAWVILPEEGEKPSIAEHLISKKRDA